MYDAKWKVGAKQVGKWVGKQVCMMLGGKQEVGRQAWI